MAGGDGNNELLLKYIYMQSGLLNKKYLHKVHGNLTADTQIAYKIRKLCSYIDHIYDHELKMNCTQYEDMSCILII